MSSNKPMGNDSRNNPDKREDQASLEEDEVEITNLDGAESLPRLFNDPPFISRRYRRPITILTVVSAVLALLVLLFNTLPIGALIKQALPVPEQTSFTLNVQANPSWGQLLIDESRVPLVDNGEDTAIKVSRGQHTLQWLAKPFAPQKCVVTLPPGSGPDNCNHPHFLPYSNDDLRSHIFFTENLALLPSYQRASLAQAAQAALNLQQSSDIVQLGEPYTLASEVDNSNRRACTTTPRLALCFGKARQPFQGRLEMQLSTDISTDDCALGLCQNDGTNCHLFCDMRDSLQQTLNPPSDQIDHANQAGWNAFVLVHLFWQFTTADGKPVTISQPDTFILGMQNDFIAQLNIRWSGQKWDVKAVPHLQYVGADAPSCEAAERDVYDLLFPVNHIVPQLHFIPGPTPAAGCLIKVDTLSLSTPTPASVPQGPAYVLQRFGVLEAVNASAHQQWSFLPVANVTMQQLTQQWYLTNTHPYRF